MGDLYVPAVNLPGCNNSQLTTAMSMMPVFVGFKPHRRAHWQVGCCAAWRAGYWYKIHIKRWRSCFAGKYGSYEERKLSQTMIEIDSCWKYSAFNEHFSSGLQQTLWYTLVVWIAMSLFASNSSFLVLLLQWPPKGIQLWCSPRLDWQGQIWQFNCM